MKEKSKKDTSKASVKKRDAQAMPYEDRFPVQLLIFLFGILVVYTAVLYGDGDNYWLEKGYSAVLMIVCILFLWSNNDMFQKNITKAFTPLFLSVTGYVLMYGITLFYSVSGKFALKEFSKIAAAFSLFIIITLLLKEKETFTGRVIKIASAALAVIGILSIDAASCRILSAPFVLMVDKLIPGAGQTYGIFESGARITSIFNMPNVFAPLMAIGIFLGLYLYLEANTQKSKIFASICLGLCVISFILAFSLGTIFTLLFSLLGLILLSPQERRSEVFVSIFLIVAVGALFSSLSFSFLGKEGFVSFLPVLFSLIFCAVVIWLKKPAQTLGQKIRMENTKNVIIALVVLAAAGIGYIILAVFITTPFEFEQTGEVLTRSEYLTPGDYGFVVESDKPMAVLIQSQNLDETIMHKNTELFAGPTVPGQSVMIKVPNNSMVVHVTFTASQNNTRLAKAYFSDLSNSVKKQKSLGLRYPLIPSFAANRFQGLWANQNAIQRFAFIGDGLKVFALNPILGSGPGAYEALQTSVQEFFYESKYVHNHYIQVLLETGVLGFLLFLSLAFFAFRIIWKNRRTKHKPLLLTTLFACCIMVFFHALIEVDLSYGVFFTVFFVLMALLSCNYGTSIYQAGNVKIKERKKITLMRGGLFVLLGLILLFLTGNVWAYQSVVSKNSEDVAGALETAVKIDPFNEIDYEMTYLALTMGEAGRSLPKADLYAEKLGKRNLFPATKIASQYYFNRGDIQKGFELSQKTLQLDYSRQSQWEDQFKAYRNYLTLENIGSKVNGETSILEIPKGIMQSYNMLLKYNKDRIEPVKLSNASLYTVMKAQAILREDPSDFALQVERVMTFLYDSSIMIDQNEDGQHDLLTAGGDENVTLHEDGSIQVGGKGPATITVPLYIGEYGKYELRLKTENKDKISSVVIDQGEPVIFTEQKDGILAYQFEAVNPLPRIWNLIITTVPNTTLGRIEIVKKG